MAAQTVLPQVWAALVAAAKAGLPAGTVVEGPPRGRAKNVLLHFPGTLSGYELVAEASGTVTERCMIDLAVRSYTGSASATTVIAGVATILNVLSAYVGQGVASLGVPQLISGALTSGQASMEAPEGGTVAVLDFGFSYEAYLFTG